MAPMPVLPQKPHADDSSAADWISDSGPDCPICLGELRGCVDIIGALTKAGRRVERELYHAACVTMMLCHGQGGSQSATGEVSISWGLSPVTRQPVDGFLPMPSLDAHSRFRDFVNWRGCKSLEPNDVSMIVAVILRMSEDAAQQLVLKCCGQSSVVSTSVFERSLMPLLEERFLELRSLDKQVPEILPDVKALERYMTLLCSDLEDQLLSSSSPEPGGRVAATANKFAEICTECANQSCDVVEPIGKAVCAMLRHAAKEQSTGAMAVSLLMKTSRRGEHSLCAAVRPLLCDEQAQVRQYAVEALSVVAHRGSAADAEAVAALLEDSDAAVRAAALDALSQIAEEADEGLRARVERCFQDREARVRNRALHAFTQLSRERRGQGVDAVFRLLQDRDVSVRRDAIAALGQLAGKGHKRVLEAVFALLSDDDADVRWGAVSALPHVVEKGHAPAVKAVVRLLNDSREPWLRSAALQTLATISYGWDRRARQAVEASQESSDPSIRDAGKKALSQMDADAETSPAPPSNLSRMVSVWCRCGGRFRPLD